MSKATALCSLKNLILSIEDSLEKEEICISDIEEALFIARGEYYYLADESVEGEK